MEKVIFDIDGIPNDTEKVQVKKALDKIEGVSKITIDRAENYIQVDYNETTTEDEIRACIERTGHQVKDVRE